MGAPFLCRAVHCSLSIPRISSPDSARSSLRRCRAAWRLNISSFAPPPRDDMYDVVGRMPAPRASRAASCRTHALWAIVRGTDMAPKPGDRMTAGDLMQETSRVTRGATQTPSQVRLTDAICTTPLECVPPVYAGWRGPVPRRRMQLQEAG